MPPSGAFAATDLSKLEYESSAIATAGQWRSPVLFIQADDDRAVPFHQTVELADVLRNLGHAQVDQLIIPNEIHDLLRHESWEMVFDATDRYFDKYLRGVFTMKGPMRSSRRRRAVPKVGTLCLLLGSGGRLMYL